MTNGSAIINTTRDLISDSVEPYRWTDVTMLTWLNEGLSALFENHPELFYESAVVITPPEVLYSLHTPLDITAKAGRIISNYVAYRCLLRDNEDPETMAQTQTFLELYTLGV